MTDAEKTLLLRSYDATVRDEWFDNEGFVIGFRRSDGTTDDELRVLRDHAVKHGVKPDDLYPEQWPRDESRPEVKS
jgi:hypothetical protein